MGITLALAACQSASDEVVVEQYDNITCAGTDCGIVRYSSPNGNDLVLETDKHIIEIQAQGGNVPYSYYVWTGGKDTSQDPDMIVQNGEALILTE